MLKREIKLPQMQLVGIAIRTNNLNESNPDSAKIRATVQGYFFRQLHKNIPNRRAPGVTFSIYTDYESDHTGDYTYFIGEEVTAFDDLPSGYSSVIIPPQTYTKFTTGPAPIPAVVIEAWQQIWQMTPSQLGGRRAYVADFEIYDDRAKDLQNAVIDIYIGIDK